MSAEKSLFNAYQEWYRLAKACGRAIRSGNAELLKECQSRVQQCQPVIARLTREARDEWQQSKADFKAKEEQLHAVVSGLMEITRENLNLIRQRRELATVKLQDCAAAGHNLKRLKSYAPGRNSHWNSFS